MQNIASFLITELMSGGIKKTFLVHLIFDFGVTHSCTSFDWQEPVKLLEPKVEIGTILQGWCYWSLRIVVNTLSMSFQSHV